MSLKDLAGLFGGSQDPNGVPPAESLDQLFSNTEDIKARWGLSAAVDPNGNPVREMSINSPQGKAILSGNAPIVAQDYGQAKKRKPVFEDIPEADLWLDLGGEALLVKKLWRCLPVQRWIDVFRRFLVTLVAMCVFVVPIR